MAESPEEAKKYPTWKSIVKDEMETLISSKLEIMKMEIVAEMKKMFNEGLNELTKSVFVRVEELECLIANNKKLIEINCEQIKEQRKNYREIKMKIKN